MPDPNTPPVDLDGLLAGFFGREMPRPWPAAPHFDAVPSAVVAARNEPRSADNSRSRWALAASAAVLLGTCWYASREVSPDAGRPAPAVSPPGLPGATAQDRDTLAEMEKHRATRGDKGR